MIIALSWLSKYVDLPKDIKLLDELLTFAGIEVEAVNELPALPQTVISAKIIEAAPVPKSDHLHQCLVDIGAYPYPEKTEQGYLQVICGAPNCHSGMIAVIALPGTALKDITIAKARIRGIESHGMLCSEKELGISDNHAGIIELPSDTPIGLEANKLFELPDAIFELEITPNRSDLLGYTGIARDLSAKLNIPLRMPETKLPANSFPSSEMPFELVNNAPELCPRYTARLFRNANISESPLWMKNALIKSGLRPINNLVDITNFVMLELGHPLHAFDYHRLAPVPEKGTTPAVVVRLANKDEMFTALDGKSYKLEGDELLIADGAKASALAGVMGGEFSAIKPDTKDIVLESAAFHPGSIRRTSYKHKLSTDSSYRFERHLSDTAADLASQRATELICELCGAEMSGDFYDSWPIKKSNCILGIRPSRYLQLIGYELDDDKIKDYLGKLGLKFLQYGTWIPGKIDDISKVYCLHKLQMEQGVTEFTENPDCIHTLYFEIPPYRVDIEREVDIIEELARLDGYDKVPMKRPPQQVMDWHAYRIKRFAADYIVSRGCFETLNYSFSEPALMHKLGFKEGDKELEMIRLRNPQSSNQSVMRTSLVPQLLINLAYNLNHGERNVRLFELGKIYQKADKGIIEPYHLGAILSGTRYDEHWQSKAVPIDLYAVKGIVSELLELLGLTSASVQASRLPFLVASESGEFVCMNKALGYFGKLQAAAAEKFGIDVIDLKQDIWLIDLDMEAIITLSRGISNEFKPIPRHPAVTRDISFLINNAVPFAEIAAAIIAVEPSVISDAKLFDEYRGKQIPEGLRSLSIHIRFQDQEKTLTDERIDLLFESIQNKLQNAWQIKMR